MEMFSSKGSLPNSFLAPHRPSTQHTGAKRDWLALGTPGERGSGGEGKCL